MLHILLTIFKILGILLLVILGILLFLILTILFVPIRYNVSGEKDETNLKANIVVSWLLHLVHFRLRLVNKEKNIELYLFGIPIFSLKNKISARKQKRSKKNARTGNTNVEEKTNGTEISQEKTKDPKNDEIPLNTDISKDKDVLEDATEQAGKSEGNPAESEEIHTQTDKNSKRNPIQKLFQALKGIPEKIKSVIDKIKLTIKNIYDKIKQGSDFLRAESTKKTIRLLLGELKLIIVHILPRKIKGKLIFGFDDPALTGEILGVASLFYPKFKDDFKIVPVFEQPVLEGKVQLKGRIVLAYLVWQVIKVLKDNDVRITWKKVHK